MVIEKTALFDVHTSLGARMLAFAGFDMPISYSSIKEEHRAVREAAGLFDVSHMGEFEVKGKEACELVQHLTCNNVADLYPGRVQYSCLMNESGGIVDDLLIYCYSTEHYFLVVNASNIDKDFDWINSHNSYEAQVNNVSQGLSLLALQGPKAWDCISELVDTDLSEMKYYHHQTVRFMDIENVLISTTGYTGSGGFEIYLPNEHAVRVWNEIMAQGEKHGLKPVGLGARDTLRLEMGFCLYGNDINDTTSPLEAGLSWIVKAKSDFLGKAVLEKQKKNGLQRRLVGFELTDRGVARHGYAVQDKDGNEIGAVTSGSLTPSVNKAVGLAYVSTEHAKRGSEIFIAVRNKSIPAIIVKTPFYKA